MMEDLGGGQSDANGGLVRHIPVLLHEVLNALRPENGEFVLDGTFGAGGYSQAILDSGAQVIGMDRDPNAIRDAAPLVATYSGRLTLVEDTFSNLDRAAPEGGLDGIVLDIGVSSMQLDEADRGFSFRQNGPLDMRMSQSGPTAADVVNQLQVGDLARIFGFLGEEKQAGRIARAIVKRREDGPFSSTRDLAGLIETVIPRRAKDKIHPATRVFQALRIYVNDELGELSRALFAAERCLKPGGRLVIVSFHSLEDRIVKKFFQNRTGRVQVSRHMPDQESTPAIFLHEGKAVVTAGKKELESNPRSRSAKLRAGVRQDCPVPHQDAAIFGLPKLVPLQQIRSGN